MKRTIYGPETRERHERRQRYVALVAAAEAFEAGAQVLVTVVTRQAPEGETVPGVVAGTRGAHVNVQTEAHGILSVPANEISPRALP